VVLSCAQDKEFADEILAEFTKQTGLVVAPKFDTESTKSVSLARELEQEKDRPRCDVHWNNEVLTMILLQRQGLLEPYASPVTEAFPASARADDNTWHAFAQRARVLLVNTEKVAEDKWPRSLLDLTKPDWKGRVAMAKPNHGTSATHAACLFEVLGAEEAKRFYRDLRANEVQIASGNKQVAEGVSAGQYWVGITDTDDAIGEVEAGKPVAIVFPDRDRPRDDRMGTLFIPNTVGVVRGCPNPKEARRLVDYLLGPEVERKLAEAASHQIPVNLQVKAQLPKEIETPATVKVMAVDFAKAADLWDEVQAFLRNEFARP
jgi:iron(III) transport system substrate-binding protein